MNVLKLRSQGRGKRAGLAFGRMEHDRGEAMRYRLRDALSMVEMRARACVLCGSFLSLFLSLSPSLFLSLSLYIYTYFSLSLSLSFSLSLTMRLLSVYISRIFYCSFGNRIFDFHIAILMSVGKWEKRLKNRFIVGTVNSWKTSSSGEDLG